MDLKTIKLILEYDGTGFSGWQVQPTKRTVQGVVEEALSTILQQPVPVTGAGRTDAGVHALGQTAHTQVPENCSCKSLLKSMNGLLKPDVVIRDICEVNKQFHARYDAVRRTYEYRMVTKPAAVGRQYSLYIHEHLNHEQVINAANQFVGEHDFSAFASDSDMYENSRCHVYESNWHPVDETIVYTISANRFLRKMVRTIVGTLIDVGKGRLHTGDIAQILESGDRRNAGNTVPPHGLFLISVSYPVMDTEQDRMVHGHTVHQDL